MKTTTRRRASSESSSSSSSSRRVSFSKVCERARGVFCRVFFSLQELFLKSNLGFPRKTRIDDTKEDNKEGFKEEEEEEDK